MANSTTLQTGTNSGAQTATDSPQVSAQPSSFSGAQTSAVQPGTTSSLLLSGVGIPLQNTQLSTVSLSGTTSNQVVATPQTHHAINPFLFAMAVVLFVIAIGLFWTTARSAKTTTN